MSHKNSENTGVGKDFEKAVKTFLEGSNYFGDKIDFLVESQKKGEDQTGIEIGNPPKPHRFDIVSENKKIVIECKCYTWTDSGNIPSAKLRGINEAAFYLSFLENDHDKYIVLAKSVSEHRENKTETLAEYYVRTNGHLLKKDKIQVLEFDVQTQTMRKIIRSGE